MYVCMYCMCVYVWYGMVKGDLDIAVGLAGMIDESSDTSLAHGIQIGSRLQLSICMYVCVYVCMYLS